MVTFPEADYPWMPTLLDIEHMKTLDSRWSSYGWDALVVPSDCPRVAERMDELSIRFVERYACRMIGQETMERWQVRLQNRFDEVVRGFERAYSIYAANQEEMLSDILPGTKTTLTGSDVNSGSDVTQASGTDARTGKTKSTDTPNSAINESDDFAGSLGKTEDSTTYGRKDTLTHGKTVKTERTQTTVLTGAQIIQTINDSVDGWRDLDTLFVSRFENLFLNTFWYRGGGYHGRQNIFGRTVQQ